MTGENLRRREIGLERRERTRQKLLQAAARVIAERGEQKATIDDFIVAAGVARGTFYNYYDTRHKLLDDLWSSVGRNPFQAIQQSCEAIKDPAERLIAETRLVLHCAGENTAWGWLVYALSVDAATVNQDLLAYPRPDLEIGRRIGRFRFDHLGAAADLVVGTVRTALRMTLQEQVSHDYNESICVMLLQALGIAEHEARSISKLPLPAL